MNIFNSLRGKSIDDQLKEAESRGAKKALEDAGIVAMDEGGSSGGGGSSSSLTKEQSEEMSRMGLSEKEYKEILRERQNKDKVEGKSPRTLINLR
jgi:molybdenum-dependent DNA-binding transcriptional regulator ModE